MECSVARRGDPRGARCARAVVGRGTGQPLADLGGSPPAPDEREHLVLLEFALHHAQIRGPVRRAWS